ncbi:hypothetical protein RRG08_048563 [Elysia crispata]|uniref:Uncharacterized protein n=1 Tax=Elysia crispata TaxID=231223 RepID=A0AAE1B5X8_9GAST|nr:hypothetical protein RRG08_048563 [Elysia crispata]
MNSEDEKNGASGSRWTVGMRRMEHVVKMDSRDEKNGASGSRWTVRMRRMDQLQVVPPDISYHHRKNAARTEERKSNMKLLPPRSVWIYKSVTNCQWCGCWLEAQIVGTAGFSQNLNLREHDRYARFSQSLNSREHDRNAGFSQNLNSREHDRHAGFLQNLNSREHDKYAAQARPKLPRKNIKQVHFFSPEKLRQARISLGVAISSATGGPDRILQHKKDLVTETAP